MPSPPLPSLESLRVLAACVRHRNFSRAAGELCLTPSAVSLRIRSLESELGVKLFVRRGPHLEVTERARLLADSVEEGLSTMRAAVQRVADEQPVLRVTCAPSFASRWLVPRLAAYQALPDAQPITLDATTGVLSADRFDVAIRSGVGPWPGLSSLELFPEQATPMLSPALAGRGGLTPKRLLELPLIPDPRWPQWFDRAEVPHAKPRFLSTRFATYELEAMAAVQGLGVALLSPLLYAEPCASGALLAPFDCTIDGPNRYWALWPQKSPAPHFVRWIQRELGTTASGVQRPRSSKLVRAPPHTQERP